MKLLHKPWFKLGINLPAFKSRNFRLYFIGQSLSLSGTFMTQVAVPWLIYDLTKSAWLLGLTGFLGFLPTLVLTPFSGVLSDRPNTLIVCGIVCILGSILFARQLPVLTKWIRLESNSVGSLSKTATQ